MPKMPALDAGQIAEHLKALPAWRLQAEGATTSIARDFRFADFTQAFAFMTQVALFAERLDHHPEWSNVYSRVSIRLTTHDAGGLSARDIELARLIDRASTALAEVTP